MVLPGRGYEAALSPMRRVPGLHLRSGIPPYPTSLQSSYALSGTGIAQLYHLRYPTQCPVLTACSTLAYLPTSFLGLSAYEPPRRCLVLSYKRAMRYELRKEGYSMLVYVPTSLQDAVRY
eukprot:1660259-Rhodomonas_salina.1